MRPAMRPATFSSVVNRPRTLVTLVSALIAVLALALPSSSGAAIAFRPCDDDVSLFLPDVECGTVDVAGAPASPTGPARPAARLFVRRLRAQRGPRIGTLFVLSGGPGQSSASFLPDLSFLLGVAGGRYDVIGVDQRGTGGSEVLDCPDLATAPLIGPGFDRAVLACARRLGPARHAYTTATSVADLDAVRQALGARRIALLGVSYGTKLALAYASFHPGNVRSLLLDSVLPLSDPHPLGLDEAPAIRRVLATLCNQRPCRRLSRDLVGDLARVIRRLRAKPRRTLFVDGAGNPRARRITAEQLGVAFREADLDPWLFEQLPGALRAALRRDYVPLARVVQDGLADVTSQPDPRDFSLANNVAVNCEDEEAVWPRGAPVRDRRATVIARFARLPAALFRPFDLRTAVELSLAASCIGWPESETRPPVRGGPLPNVPTLLLNGRLDMRTGQGGARSVAREIPRAQLVLFTGQGHSLLTADPTACSLRLAQRFLEDGRAGGTRCARQTHSPVVRPLPPRSIGSLAPVRGIRGTRGRVATAVYRTLRDAYERTFTSPFERVRRGGLRGGRWTGTSRRVRFPRAELPDPRAFRRFLGDVDFDLDLESTVYVPHVEVTGEAHSSLPDKTFVADVEVDGRMSGTLTFSGVLRPSGFDGLKVRGTLGGRKVRGFVTGRNG
jgi:pimeloyl-ACP methyl ester carboxylesterase